MRLSEKDKELFNEMIEENINILITMDGKEIYNCIDGVKDKIVSNNKLDIEIKEINTELIIENILEWFLYEKLEEIKK